MKQISRVLEAAQSGCQTSAEVAAKTGLSVAFSSRWINELIELGLLRRSGLCKRVAGRHGVYKIFEA